MFFFQFDKLRKAFAEMQTIVIQAEKEVLKLLFRARAARFDKILSGAEGEG